MRFALVIAITSLLVLDLVGRASAEPDPRLTKPIEEFQEALKTAKDPVTRSRLVRDLDALNAVRSGSIIGAGLIRQDVFVVDRAIVLPTDTVIVAGTVIFKPGGRLVTNGHLLFIDAREFNSEGGPAAIDASGPPGDPGPPGVSSLAPWQSREDRDYWSALNDCRSNPRHPDRGPAGGMGGKGGDGGIVLLTSTIGREKVNIKLDGGPGGPGGKGGVGRLLRNGRNFYCDGCTMNCPEGPAGQPGPSGATGDIIVIPVAPLPAPPFREFDAVSDFRYYRDDSVPSGKLRITVHNQHPVDPVRFELWRTSSGSSFVVEVEGHQSRQVEIDATPIERLVWFGHHTLLLNARPEVTQGWSLQFRRRQ